MLFNEFLFLFLWVFGKIINEVLNVEWCCIYQEYVCVIVYVVQMKKVSCMIMICYVKKFKYFCVMIVNFMNFCDIDVKMYNYFKKLFRNKVMFVSRFFMIYFQGLLFGFFMI